MREIISTPAGNFYYYYEFYKFSTFSTLYYYLYSIL